MNTGIIASRYAAALHRYVTLHGDADRVCAQAKVLEQALGRLPDFRRLVDDPAAVTRSEKMAFFRSALGGEELAPALERFLSLVMENGRIADLRFILHDYTALYYASRNIHFATLSTAVPVPDPLLEKIHAQAVERIGGEVVIEKQVDPSLIGGGVFTVDGYRVDASVRTQLQTLHTQFNEQNKRIV